MNLCKDKDNEIQQKRAIVTVVGRDQVGIIANVTGILASHSVNILDISQTILQDFFTMIMVVDISGAEVSLQGLQEILNEKGKTMSLQINAQHEDIFKFMHRV